MNKPVFEKIELRLEEDGNGFINFWDWAHGNDVCIEYIDGKLIHEGEFIEFPDFIAKIRESVNKRTV